MFRAVLLLLACTTAASAQLTWEKPLQEFQRVPEDKFVEARFAFKNTGPTPITIRSTRTSCGCTTAELDKRTYAPGESGAIESKFTFSGRIGAQRKIITVVTEEAPKEPMVLDLRVWVNQPMKLQPSLVFWKRGEPPAAKTVQLTAEGPLVGIQRVTSSNPNLQAKLNTIRPGAEYSVTITPQSTAQKDSAELTVFTDFPLDAPRSYKIHARIK